MVQEVGIFIFKLRYTTRIKEYLTIERVWWWRSIWMLAFPLKKNLSIIGPRNIILPWNNGYKRNYILGLPS